MKILTVDIGTGTQDIFLYNAQLHIENGFKLVVPSPTMNVHRRVKEATRARAPILLSGVMMGGGPSAWAVQEHLRAGLPVYATPSAAQTLDDELDKVRALGVEIVSDDKPPPCPIPSSASNSATWTCQPFMERFPASAFPCPTWRLLRWPSSTMGMRRRAFLTASFASITWMNASAPGIPFRPLLFGQKTSRRP